MLWYVFEYTPHILKYSRSGLTLTLKLPASKSFLLIRTYRVQDIVSIWCVIAKKRCRVDIQVKIWSCMLSYKTCHPTLLCLQHHFGTILTIFAKFKYYFDFDKLAIALKPSGNEELCPFPILIEKYRVLQLLWSEKCQSR